MDLAKLHLHWRSCRRDKKEYKSYSLARAYRSDGKNRKEIVLKLGKLDDEEVSRWRAALQAAKKSKTNTSVDLENFTISSNSSHLDVAVILEAWDFWDIKSFIEISPVHVWKPEHVKAHYTICVLSHLIDRTLSWLLHKEKGSRTKEIVSHARLYEELSGCRLNHVKLNPSQNLCRLTEPTSRQKELLTRLGMKYLVEDVAVKTLTTRAMEAVTSK